MVHFQPARRWGGAANARSSVEYEDMLILVRRIACLSCALVAMSVIGMSVIAMSVALSGSPAAADDRSTELMRYQCSSSLGRRDITLFANGTVRLRQGLWDAQELYLDELLREELASYVKKLRDIQSSTASSPTDLVPNAMSGKWIEHCEIQLSLPGAESTTYAFSAYDIPSLVVAGLIHVAEDLAAYTRPPDRPERLPKGYLPRPGHILRAADGGRFQVMGLTGDGLGVELVELESPVMIFVSIEELGDMFVALEEPGRR